MVPAAQDAAGGDAYLWATCGLTLADSKYRFRPRGRWVAALVAAEYRVFAVNPMQVARYRQRHCTSGANSDATDAHTLADMVCTDAHQLRPVAGDTALAEGIKVVTRPHQSMIWDRTRHVLRLRSTLREFFPGRCGRSGPARFSPCPLYSRHVSPGFRVIAVRPKRGSGKMPRTVAFLLDHRDCSRQHATQHRTLNYETTGGPSGCPLASL